MATCLDCAVEPSAARCAPTSDHQLDHLALNGRWHSVTCDTQPRVKLEQEKQLTAEFAD